MPPLRDFEAARDLDDVLTWNVVRVARFVGNRLAERLVDLGLNPIQFGVLAFLEKEGELTTAEIARAVLLRPQSVAPLLDGLEARGTRPDPSCRRPWQGATQPRTDDGDR